jgi:hypothetical protein
MHRYRDLEEVKRTNEWGIEIEQVLNEVWHKINYKNLFRS